MKTTECGITDINISSSDMDGKYLGFMAPIYMRMD